MAHREFTLERPLLPYGIQL